MFVEAKRVASSQEANVPPEGREDGRSGLEQNSQASLSRGVESDQGFDAQAEGAWVPPAEDEGQYPVVDSEACTVFSLREDRRVTPLAPWRAYPMFRDVGSACHRAL